jgi:hypothetical protein
MATLGSLSIPIARENVGLLSPNARDAQDRMFLTFLSQHYCAH